MQAADFAFKQAFALCPSSAEAVISYVNFLTKEGRKADALAIAHAAVVIDPKNDTFRDVERNLGQEIQSRVTASGTNRFAISRETLKELQTLVIQKEAEYNQQKALNDKLKTLSREDLKKALPIVYNDTRFNSLMTDLDVAERELRQVSSLYAPEHPLYRRDEAVVQDIQEKINDRVDGVMLGLDARLSFSQSYLDTLKKDLEEARKAVETAR
jgi:uncharacterized protein involved in exopolysaccharide biosynthesis